MAPGSSSAGGHSNVTRIFQETLREVRHVLGPCPQGRDRDDILRQPEEKILTKATPLHMRLKILVSGCDHPHVEFDHLFAAHSAQGSILKRSEERLLSDWREISNLIEKDRPAVRCSSI